MSDQRDYVLGTQDEELDRLGIQHQIWRSQAYRIWERAKFVRGDRVLDVGCGPGFATADLSALLGPGGSVRGIDASSKFVDRVKSLKLPNVQVSVGDVQALNDQLSAEAFDGAYCRWVLCFVPDSQRVIDGVARALKRGGRFAIQDYYNYSAIKLAPKSEIFARVIRAVDDSWRSHGGDPDIGCRMPELLDRAGLDVAHLKPIVRIGRPDDSIWQWPTTFFGIFVPTLVKTGFLTVDEQRAFEREWQARSSDKNAFFSSPPMVDVIAVKR
ncbi:methyltransferase domain-containing protein [soil metagenome]